MKVTITIECYTAAFNEPYDELARILKGCPGKVLRQVERPPCICVTPETDDLLHDLNGNVVGGVQVGP